MDMEQARAAELQQLLWRGEEGDAVVDWPQLLAPYADLFASREPLLAWPLVEAESPPRLWGVRRGVKHLAPMLWVVSLERTERGGAFPAEEILRYILSLPQPVEAYAGPQSLLERSYSVRQEGSHGVRTSPLDWLLLCRREYAPACTLDIGPQRLELVLRLGANPNRHVSWHGVPGSAQAEAHSPLWTTLTHYAGLHTAAVLLRFGARFHPTDDIEGLAAAMRHQDVVRVLRLFQRYPDALQGVQHTTRAASNHETPLHVLASERSQFEPGAVNDARFLHEALGVTALARDARGDTAADRAEERSTEPDDFWGDTPAAIAQHLAWANALAVYLRHAEAAEALEARRRMSLAAHQSLASRLGSELTAHVGNELLPRDRFARFGREPPPPI